jgi:hypothetical protein
MGDGRFAEGWTTVLVDETIIGVEDEDAMDS